MPEVDPEHTPLPTAVIGWDGVVWRAFAVDAAGQLQIDVLGNANLDDALESVAADRLIVRGEDQLHSFDRALGANRVAAISGADGWVDSATCPAGEVWHVTNILAYDATTATTATWFNQRIPPTDYLFHYQAAAKAAAEPWVWRGDVWLEEADTIRVTFIGGLAGDSCRVSLVGEIMTKEV